MPDFAVLLAEHRAIEAALDALPASFSRTLDLVLHHYAGEEKLLPGPDFDKMRAQHEEARELGVEVLRSLESGHAGDVERLTRRFVAIVQHNIIEEERDVFPYYHQRL